jgi:hypothetical protein
MKIDLRIDAVVLEGLALAPGERGAFERALRREVARLLVEHGVPSRWPADGGELAPPAVGLKVGRSDGPDALGRQVGAALWHAISETPTPTAGETP